ncbi:MAG: efflux RND transporter permease subunit [Bacteroidota bacterium]
MKLPKLAIDNYAFVVVLVFMGLSTGILSFLNMPRSEDPALDFPFHNIVAVYPGTSPEDLEQLVVDPIEDRLNELEDVREIKSTMLDGVAIINVESEFEVDVDDRFDEVNAKVNAARSELPDGLISLEVTQFSPLNVVILQLALLSPTAPYNELLDWAEKLEGVLEKVDGVRTVDLEAYPEEEVRIALDMEKMARLQIPLNQLAGIIQSNNANIPGGEVKAGTRSFALKTSGGYKSVEELKETVIASRNGKLVHLKDIARVYLSYEDEQYLARMNGERALFVSVTQKKGKNILAIVEALEKEVEAFKPLLPENMVLNYAFEQGPAVSARINDFFINLLQGILLVGVVILIFLGIRNSLIVMTVIPTSILIAIFLLDLSGFGLQQISIAGLVIALGLLVDNGIVVVENISRFVQQGMPLKEAAAKGTSEVGWALVSSTATTMLAFFPMTQLGGGTGQFIQSMPITVIFSLLASLVLALALTPLLASKLMRKKVSDKLNAVERFMQGLVQNVYRGALNFALARPVVMVLLGVASLAGSIALFPYVGVSFFPSADKPLLVININTPEGTNLTRTNEAALFVESVLDSMEEVRGHVTNVGHGNPQIYYNLIPKNFDKQHAQVLAHLEKWENRSFYATIDKLRSKFAGYTGARITVNELKNGPPSEAPIAIRVIGDNLDSIRHYSLGLEALIASKEGVINVDNPLAQSKTTLRTKIKRDKAGMLGVQLADIDFAVRTSMTGNRLGIMNTDDGEKYPITVRMDKGEDARISDFQRVAVASQAGAQVPLSQLAQLQFQADASKINHYDLERNTIVTADVMDGYNVTSITQDLINDLDKIKLPTGYSFFIAGEYQTQQESFGDLGQMLLIAILGIFAVLVLQFKSFSQPFVVLSAIPLAFSGSIVALFLAGYSFSFLAFVGFTSLVGIVVNTSIILVDYANQLRAKGLPLREALQQASETRFTPILLTTLTTILGLLPLTLSGSNLWAPLGWTIIGGMVSSTILTLLIVPVLYQWLTPKEG